MIHVVPAGRLDQLLSSSLAVWEVWGSILVPPTTRYTLRRYSASINNIYFFLDAVLNVF